MRATRFAVCFASFMGLRFVLEIGSDSWGRGVYDDDLMRVRFLRALMRSWFMEVCLRLGGTLD